MRSDSAMGQPLLGRASPRTDSRLYNQPGRTGAAFRLYSLISPSWLPLVPSASSRAEEEEQGKRSRHSRCVLSTDKTGWHSETAQREPSPGTSKHRTKHIPVVELPLVGFPARKGMEKLRHHPVWTPQPEPQLCSHPALLPCQASSH